MHCWEPQITLDMIIIAGEIARLYLSQSCEKRIWLLAYKLASALENKGASLYGMRILIIYANFVLFFTAVFGFAGKNNFLKEINISSNYLFVESF